LEVWRVERSLADLTGRLSQHIVWRKDAESRAHEANRRLGEQAAELTRVNTELEQFACFASHDPRQPLRTVGSYVGLIERRLGSETNPDMREFIGFARGGVARMDRLITDLLDYTRIGHANQTKEPVSLALAVEEALLNLNDAVGQADAVITVQAALPTVPGKRSELVRLFQNLMGNALKYREPGRPSRIAVTTARDGGHWVVSIADNGIGQWHWHSRRYVRSYLRRLPAPANPAWVRGHRDWLGRPAARSSPTMAAASG
jgi:light-regulated signal transduction histidine kinase (bacteriophytochrome)